MSVRKARVPIFRPKGRLNCLASPPTATLSTALNTAYAVASMGFVGSGMDQCDWGAVQLLGQKVLTTVPCKDGQRAPDLPFGAATGTGAQPGPTWPTTPTPGWSTPASRSPPASSGSGPTLRSHFRNARDNVLMESTIYCKRPS